MSEAREAAAQVPLHELLLDFAHAARTRGVKATDKGEHHVCTPVFEDGHGFAMHPISMFEEAAMRLKRDAEKGSPVVTDEMCQAAMRMVVLKTRIISGQPQLPDIAAMRAALEAALSVKGGE